MTPSSPAAPQSAARPERPTWIAAMLVFSAMLFVSLAASLSAIGVATYVLAATVAPPAPAAEQCVAPASADRLHEVEERTQLSSSSATKVCAADGRDLYSYTCTLEEAETDQIIYRGGSGVTSTDGLQHCDSCNMGPVISGDSRHAYLIAASSSPYVRCVCGYR